MEGRRELGEDTGISYETPPELFVEEWNPPGEYPEKPTKEEILVRWALTPENVQQAWRDYEVCRQEAMKWILQIKELNLQYDRARRIHISNVLKATTKLGRQTAGIIVDGVQMLYSERLRAAREAARLKNDFERARMLGSSLAEIEQYTQWVTKTQQARQTAMQSSAQLKETLEQWNRRMEKPYWEGLGAGGDADKMITEQINNLDPSTRRYLSGNNNPRKIIREYLRDLPTPEGIKSQEDALTYALKTALKDALTDMKARENELETAQKTLQTALAKANMILESSAGVVDSVIGVVDKVVGKPPALGGLDMDDPAILAEGQANLERLQNRINWLQKHYQMAMNCVNENMGTIQKYNEAQQAEQRYNELQQAEQNKSEVKGESEMREK
jgi:hypothetical protein